MENSKSFVLSSGKILSPKNSLYKDSRSFESKFIMALPLKALIVELTDGEIFLAKRKPPSLETGITFIEFEHVLDERRNAIYNKSLIKSMTYRTIFSIENNWKSKREIFFIDLIYHNSLHLDGGDEFIDLGIHKDHVRYLGHHLKEL